jgi:hypothetical protein
MGFVRRVFKSGGIKQNASCGNHIHVKLRSQKVMRAFGREEIWNEFIRRYKATWRGTSKYSARLHNYYCNSTWKSDLDPIENGYDHDKRYCMINLQSLEEDQETLEFRILPRFDSGVEAIQSYIKLLTIINDMAAEIRDA